MHATPVILVIRVPYATLVFRIIMEAVELPARFVLLIVLLAMMILIAQAVS